MLLLFSKRCAETIGLLLTAKIKIKIESSVKLIKQVTLPSRQQLETFKHAQIITVCHQAITAKRSSVFNSSFNQAQNRMSTASNIIIIMKLLVYSKNASKWNCYKSKWTFHLSRMPFQMYLWMWTSYCENHKQEKGHNLTYEEWHLRYCVRCLKWWLRTKCHFGCCLIILLVYFCQ